MSIAPPRRHLLCAIALCCFVGTGAVSSTKLVADASVEKWRGMPENFLDTPCAKGGVEGVALSICLVAGNDVKPMSTISLFRARFSADPERMIQFVREGEHDNGPFKVLFEERLPNASNQPLIGWRALYERKSEYRSHWIVGFDAQVIIITIETRNRPKPGQFDQEVMTKILNPIMFDQQ